MAKKLIILSGSDNSGKSETLKCLVKKLGGKLTANYDDRYICKKGTSSIAICTGGDDDYAINENKNFFSKNTNCDVYISAARTKGATIKNLSDWANSNKIDRIIVSKSCLTDPNNRIQNTNFNDYFADFLNSLI